MKAQIHSLEAIIACSLIASILVLFIYRPPLPPELTKLSHKLDAYNGLKILDESGELRRYALERNASAIKNALNPYIRVSYDVVLYNETNNITSIPSLPTQEIVGLSYYIAGDIGEYSAIEIRVYLWGFS